MHDFDVLVSMHRCCDARGIPAYMRVIHSLTVSLHSLPDFPPPLLHRVK